MKRRPALMISLVSNPDHDNHNRLHVPTEVLGVCGTSPGLPGTLIVSVMVEKSDIEV